VIIPSMGRMWDAEVLIAAALQIREDHDPPRIVAAWCEPCPQPIGRDSAAVARLAREVEEPLRTFNHPRTPSSRPIWHCQLRADPRDRPLSDTQWADLAHEIVNVTGIAPTTDPDGCPWIAIRTSGHKLQVIAPLLRRDGRPPRMHNAPARAAALCQTLTDHRPRFWADRGSPHPVSRPTTTGASMTPSGGINRSR